MTAPDVTVSIVSFNTRDLLRACLKAVAATSGLRSEVYRRRQRVDRRQR